MENDDLLVSAMSLDNERAGNLGPMYFLDSVNMDGPVVAKQSEVGISYSGSVQFPSVPKKHLNIPNVVPQF